MTQRGEAPARSSDRSYEQRTEGSRAGRRLRSLAVSSLTLLALAFLFVTGWWSYRLAVSWLGPFAPLAVALVGAIAVAIIGPALLVRYGAQVRAVVVHSAT